MEFLNSNDFSLTARYFNIPDAERFLMEVINSNYFKCKTL